MARQLREWVAEPVACAYLPLERSTLEYRLLLDVSGDELDELLARGWRRFGPAYFRPACRACSECVPLRIPVDQFRMSKQQRRVWNKVKNRLEVVEQTPQIDEARLNLYHRWHASQGDKRDWPADAIDSSDYYHQFAFPHACGKELSYWDTSSADGERTLVGVAITDFTPNALSAVYTYYNPDYAYLSPGIASVLFQIETARATGRHWLYLGFRVLGCPSSEYKARFQPHELLLAGRMRTFSAWEKVSGRWR